jgi:hypothetical protein
MILLADLVSGAYTVQDTRAMMSGHIIDCNDGTPIDDGVIMIGSGPFTYLFDMRRVKHVIKGGALVR